MDDPPPRRDAPVFIVARPQIAEDVISPTRSKFTIEPLEPGFGYTVGNSLRRTLLSSIPGAAISSVRIEGGLHEFSTIAKVTEDVTDIILNLKELVIRTNVEEPVTMYLKAKGPGEDTAGDIPPPAGRCSSWCSCSPSWPRLRAWPWDRPRTSRRPRTTGSRWRS